MRERKCRRTRKRGEKWDIDHGRRKGGGSRIAVVKGLDENKLVVAVSEGE